MSLPPPPRSLRSSFLCAPGRIHPDGYPRPGVRVPRLLPHPCRPGPGPFSRSMPLIFHSLITSSIRPIRTSKRGSVSQSFPIIIRLSKPASAVIREWTISISINSPNELCSGICCEIHTYSTISVQSILVGRTQGLS